MRYVVASCSDRGDTWLVYYFISVSSNIPVQYFKDATKRLEDVMYQGVLGIASSAKTDKSFAELWDIHPVTSIRKSSR